MIAVPPTRQPLFRLGLTSLAFLCALPSGCGDRKVPVAGQVLNAQGKEVRGVVVTFWPADPSGQSFATLCDGSGHFTLHCPRGNYKVTIAPHVPGDAKTGIPDLGPVGGMPQNRPGTSKLPVPVPECYWKVEYTPLTAEVPAGGLADLTLSLLDQLGK
jgi:hypothetical protein